MNNYYVYELCSSETSSLPFYIGKGKRNSRMYSHESSALRGTCRNKHLQRKILKLKRNGYSVIHRKIAENVSEQNAFTIEKDMIAFNRSLGFKLCNHTDGGDGVSGREPWNKNKVGCFSEEAIKKMKKSHTGKKLPPRTEEHRKNLSLSHIGRPPHSEETKRKIGNVHIGKIPWNKGLTKETDLRIHRGSSWNKGLTKETDLRIKRAGEIISKSNTGKKRSEEAKRNIREGAKHRSPVSEETKRKQSESAKNRPPISEITRKKMSLASSSRSNETKQKISAALIGKLRSPMPEEIKRKISNTLKNKNQK
jgi:hypothetical protein